MIDVKVGKAVIIDGSKFSFSNDAANLFNTCLRLVEKGAELDIQVFLHRGDSKGRRGFGEFFSFSKIKEALDTAEFNKTRHGL